jgi:hypothetical protein
MARRGDMTSLTERLTIRDRAAEGATDAVIAAELRRSIWTVRKWRRRGQRGTMTALATRIGRPPAGPLSTWPTELKTHILELRRTHPGWGALTILVELQRDPVWNQQPLPSRARIGAVLQAAGLTRRPQRHTTLPEPEHPPDPAPHDLWELDAKGPGMVDGVGMVSTINIIDVGGRVKVESTPTACAAPNREDYQIALRRGFLTYGLPNHLSFDRGTVFFDNTCPSPFPTRIHLWLIALGIQVQFTRARRPTDHGIIERHHQTINAQVIQGQTWADLQALWQGLDERREVLNTAIPCRPCGNLPPLQAAPHAIHSGRPYRPEWEEDLLDMSRVGDYLVGAYWVRQGSPNGMIGLGGTKYWVGPAIAKQGVKITFDPAAWCFMLHTAGSAADIVLAPQGLTKAALMGAVSGFLRLPSYQLAFPLDPAAWRANQHATLVHHA